MVGEAGSWLCDPVHVQKIYSWGMCVFIIHALIQTLLPPKNTLTHRQMHSEVRFHQFPGHPLVQEK